MAQTLSTWTPEPVTHRVYVRRANAAPPINGELDGWTRAADLRCDWVRVEAGARPGAAQFTYVGDGPDFPATERVLTRYRTDDQLRVLVDPVIDPLVQQPPPLAPGLNGRLLFEGVIMRPAFDIQPTGESQTFTAIAMPVLDNEHTLHRVIGRWTSFVTELGDVAVYFETETPDMPAVFNFRGRPNRHATKTAPLSLFDARIVAEAPLWTDDLDPAGRYWTLRDAILTLLAGKLYGFPGRLLPRNVDLDESTATALATPASAGLRPDQFAGIDHRLPADVSVQGMGALEAIEAVCSAAGFEMAIEPVMQRFADFGEEDPPPMPNRNYALRIWRTGTGTNRVLDLAKRGSAYATPQAATAANNVGALRGMKDTAEVVNEIVAAGPQFLEVKVELRPLWSPDQMEETDAAVFAKTAITDEDLADDGGYHGRHVASGVAYERYRHVGRHWGLDERGGFAGYGDDPYQQPEEGYDWVTELNLNGVAHPIRERRAAFGLTTAIHWMRRTHLALPLKSPAAVAAGVRYIVEVSEDAGETWARCATRVTSLGACFGVQFEINNLGLFNLGVQSKGKLEGDSWWQLILDEQLRVRLTCCIQADTAQRFDALRQATSGTAYRRGRWTGDVAEELWVQPGTVFNTSTSEAGWLRYVGGVADAGDAINTDVRALAERRRDALEDAVWSLAPRIWLMEFDSYRLGDRITQVRGRNLELTRPPNVVGITYRLSGAAEQAIELSLGDQRFAGAR